jgi:hypothetical protein
VVPSREDWARLPIWPKKGNEVKTRKKKKREEKKGKQKRKDEEGRR